MAIQGFRGAGAVLILAALAGCGSAVSPGTPEADKQAAVILADAAKALRHTTSYRVTGMIDPGVVVDVVVVPGRFRRQAHRR